jgi:cytochrome subunit of sulfide dehydrogenase
MKRHSVKLAAASLAGLAVAGALALTAGLKLSSAGANAPAQGRAAPALTAAAYLPSLTTSLQVSLQSPTAGRLLASNCFQCHGTDGKSAGGIDRLAGMSASEIIDEMQSMRVEAIGNNIMKAHARGYTDAELLLIADYFSRQ